MKTLPAGWEETCLRAALDGAGLTYRIAAGLRGAPIATLGYGATAAETIPFRAQVAPGAMRITAIVGALEEPTDEQLEQLDAVCVDWALGTLAWNGDSRTIEANVTLHAYPGVVPDADTMRGLIHFLWSERATLGGLRAAPFEGDPASARGDLDDVVAAFAQAGLALARQRDGSWATSIDPGDEGACTLRIATSPDFALTFDALPRAAAPWRDDHASRLAQQALNVKLMMGAVTRWSGGQMVWRHRVPIDLLPSAHAEWPGLIADHATLACLDIARIARGGSVSRDA